MNAMTATSCSQAATGTRSRAALQKMGAILGAAALHRLTSGDWPGLCLCTDATVADDESIIGDPTEAAFVVLAAKTESTPRRRGGHRDVRRSRSTRIQVHGHAARHPGAPRGRNIQHPHFASVKGAPRRRHRAVRPGALARETTPIAEVRDEILAANQHLSEQGLRVLAFAARDLDDASMATAIDDPMSAVSGLVLVALVGIIDPLRAEAKEAVRVALSAGVDVRMITGDHTITARAIADELGLGPGVITGTDLSHLSDAEVVERLPQLHVFGRVAPRTRSGPPLMQEAGHVVAMTGMP
jgi:Ca2+-transporting ATPase